MALSESVVTALHAVSLDPSYVEDLVHRTLAEDLTGDPLGDFGQDGLDVTSIATIPSDQVSTGDLVARAEGVIAGLPIAAAVFDVASAGIVTFTAHIADSAQVTRSDVCATVTGPTRALLAAERSALNLLCRASGVATHTARWIHELAGTSAKVLDTRKTTPGLRTLEKYAVRCGGGVNKRMGL